VNSIKDQIRFFNDLLDNLPGLFFIMDEQGRYIRWNDNTERVLGYSAEELMNKPGIEMVCPEDRQMVSNTIVDAFRDGSGSVEYRKVTKDGEVIPMLAQAVRLKVEGRDLIVGVQMDISARKRAEAQLESYQEDLRSLASRVLLAEEAERRRIAVGLHDSAAQNLALAIMKLRVLEAGADSPDLVDEVGHIRSLVSETANELRSLSLDLSPPELYEIGIGAALESLADRVGRERRFECRYECRGDEVVLGRDVRLLVYRCVSELLANVVKHAEASEVVIRSVFGEGRLEVGVIDNGLGFRVSESIKGPAHGGGFGLFSIRERLRAVGGTLRIISEPGGGAEAVLIMPIETEG